jgi:hypothetical protein
MQFLIGCLYAIATMAPLQEKRSVWLKKVLNDRKVGATAYFAQKGKETTRTQLTYLGSFHEKGKTYFVISEFRRLKAAIVWHGRNRFIFLAQDGGILAEYDAPVLESGLGSIRNGFLKFKYDNGEKMIKDSFRLAGFFPHFLRTESGMSLEKVSP